MKQVAFKAILAAMMAASGLSTVPSTVSAQEIQLYLGGHHRPPPPDYQPSDDDDDGLPSPGYGHRRPPPPGYGRGCDPQFAASIASRNGLRRAHVVDVSPRRIVVDGFTRRGPDEMVFANVRGCPIIDE